MKEVKITTSEKDLELRILKKQIDMLYRNQLLGLAITSVAIFLLFMELMSILNWVALEDLTILFIAVIFFRIITTFFYYSAKKNKTIHLKRAEYFYMSGVMCTGIFWSLTILSLFPVISLDYQILIIIAALGFASSLIATMGYLKKPVCSYILFMLLPLIYVINNSDFVAAQTVAFATFLYLLFMLRMAIVFYNSTYEMLRMQELSKGREDELRLQKEKSSAANMAKSEFLSRMSHELRTPLNAILGLSELQLSGESSPLANKQSARMHKISDAGKHLLSIVDDVLDFSCIETGSVEINLEVVNLYEIVKDSIRLVESKALLRDVVVYADKIQPKVCVLADPTRLKQIIVNLLDNAIKYNKHGGKVLLSTEVCVNKQVRLFVTDTGYGLRSQDIGKLFVPFSRLGAESRGIDGAGIGLSLCKEFVELMNGSIGIHSQINEGSSFWVELPYVSSEKVCTDIDIPRNFYLKTDGSLKILLVEDNLVNSEVAVDMLVTLGIGIGVDVANNGEQALELFDANKYSLILMDCEMPIMDGFTATKLLRKKERESHQYPIPIIALTAHAISGSKEKCLACGMDDFLSKPFSLSGLSLILSQWLKVEITDVPYNMDKLKISDADMLQCNADVLDCEILSKLYAKQKKNGTDILNNLVGIYLEQSSQLLDELLMASRKSDVESVRKISHTLKSSSVNVGALKFSKSCREVELTCEQELIDDELIQAVYQSYPSVEAALKVVLQNIK